MSTRIRYYDETGRDVTAQIELNAAMGAAQFTLRDFFAGCALMGRLANQCETTIGMDAVRAYEYAEAMIMARPAC